MLCFCLWEMAGIVIFVCDTIWDLACGGCDRKFYKQLSVATHWNAARSFLFCGLSRVFSRLDLYSSLGISIGLNTWICTRNWHLVCSVRDREHLDLINNFQFLRVDLLQSLFGVMECLERLGGWTCTGRMISDGWNSYHIRETLWDLACGVCDRKHLVS